MKLTELSNFVPSKRASKMRVTLIKVKRQVRIYREAKSAGKLRHVTGADRAGLFNV
jgi:hypothetical protein